MLCFRCIRGALKEKVVILVTHQLHFLKNVDKIIVLEKGEIVESGTYNELMSNTRGRLYMLLEERSGQSDISDLDTSSASRATMSVKSEDEPSKSNFARAITSREDTIFLDNDR